MRHQYSSWSFLAFCMGLVSTLFVSTPVGFVAMLDMASFALAIPLYLTQYQTYSKYFRRFLLLGVLWILNAIVTDFYRATPFMVAFKAEMIMVNSLTLAIVGAWILRKTPNGFVLFLVGSSISSVVSLYCFQNGAYLSYAVQQGYSGEGSMTEFLVEKQVKPIWVNMFMVAGIYFMRKMMRLSWPICITAFMAGGFYLLIYGGSRSTFLVMVSAAILMMFYFYIPRLYEVVFKKKFLRLCCIVIAAISFNALYMVMAKSGYLGEEGYAKYLAKKSGEVSFMDDRADFLIDWPFLWRSPLIGAGTLMIDRWGYLDKSPYLRHYNPVNGRPIHHTTFAGHSCVVFAWCANGLFGLLFWLYVLWLIFDFLGMRIYSMGEMGPFLIYALLAMVWNILFSPYGIFRGQAMFMAAFLALMKDQRFQDWMVRTGLSSREMVKYRRLIANKR